MTQSKDLVDRFWKAFEANQFGEIPRLMDENCEFRMPGVPPMQGLAALEGMLRAYRAAFPDLRHETKSHVESGDLIAVELVVTGTHTGPMQTPQGVVPATGKKVVWESCDYIRVKNDKIVSWHVYQDSMPFLTALGLVRPAA